MSTVCEKNMCTGCMACVEVCSKGAIKIIDNLESFNAVIQKEKCIGCNMCKHVCQNNSTLDLRKPVKWQQGWSNNDHFRGNGASGGIATSLMESFIEKKNGYVCGCTFSNGIFKFEIVNQVNQINRFAGSKYVKSNPKSIYKDIRRLLHDEKNVLFIGLPCQVAGLKKFIGKDMVNLYTIDLICHGTPSQKLLERYLCEHDFDLSTFKDLRFREKSGFRLNDQFNPITNKDLPDRYLFAFLKSLIYTDNCYHCNFAGEKRISDITLGDSWGSNLSMEDQRKGISLAMTQTKKGEELVNIANVHLEDVDKTVAIKHNAQLNRPVSYNDKRDRFFDYLKNGKKFDFIIFKLYPIIFIRQYIKYILKKIGIIRGGVSIIRYGLYYKD